PKTIIRQPEVLRRTGLSRSSIYRLIANGEFPHQILLGASSVGWVEQEVSDWIMRRARMRPNSESQSWSLEEKTPQKTEEAIPFRHATTKEKVSANPRQTHRATSPDNLSKADLFQLELIGTNFYVDNSTGALWIQVLRPKPSGSEGRL